MRVGLYDAPLFREHDAGPAHPERPERLDAVRRGLRDAGLEARLALPAPRPATGEELLRVHTARHVALVASSQGRTLRFDPDTQAGPRSYQAALLAAGAALDAVERVLDGTLDRAFCAVRPPGHHAEPDRAMGFCLFNNVAIAAAHALARGVERVLIIDSDVHHGNGTQAIFYDDPRVLYVSSHAYPFYPGTGSAEETGAGAGRGFTVNLPVASGCGDAEYEQLYRGVVAPIGISFDPDLLLVSFGFDPHEHDPLGPMRVTAAGFAQVMSACLRTAGGAAAGRAVVVLEGGYDLDGIAASSASVMRTLLGEECAPSGLNSPHAERLVARYRRLFAPCWPALRG
jgi:acetoin utilization deacetylase AcuC-like enzyme